MSNGYKDFFDKAQAQKGVRKAPSAPVKRSSKSPPVEKKRTNFLVLALTFFGFIVTMTGTFYVEEIERFISRIEIGSFAQARAQVSPAAEASGSPKNETEKASNTGAADQSSNGVATASGTIAVDDIELNHFARLRERKKELDKREEDLNKLEAEIAQQRQEVEQKLKELEDVRRKISSVLEEKVQVDDQKIENLVQFYSNMKAPQAAKIIETIDENLAVQVIARMKKKNAADIMNLLKPEKAQAISEKYVGYRK